MEDAPVKEVERPIDEDLVVDRIPTMSLPELEGLRFSAPLD